MRYWALIGSTNNWTPRFSTQKSPSSIFSSNVNPYWKPEQPPPDTNTRSFKLGLASSRISSPTFPAAASVNTSTFGGGGSISGSASDVAFMMCSVLGRPQSIKAPGLNLRPWFVPRGSSRRRGQLRALGAGRDLAPRRARDLRAGPPVVQFPIYAGADRGFNDAVKHAAEHLCL